MRAKQGQLKYVLMFAIALLIIPHFCFSQYDGPNNKRTVSDRIFHPLNTLSCTGSLGDPIVNFTFGSGVGNGAPLPPNVISMQYLTNSCPNDGQYTITNYTSNCFNGVWHSVTDHTGDPNGYFLLVNASFDPSVFYVQQVDGLCSGTTYQFSAWVVNVMNRQSILPNITFNIEKTDGTVLQTYNTGDIPVSGSPEWKQYGMFFTTPAGVSSVVIRLTNNAPGGFGNDIGLDDIQFRPAGPSTTITASMPGDSINLCHAGVSLNATIESCYFSNEYQWQISVNNGNWKGIPGAKTASYTTSVLPPGKYRYRLLVSAAGNIALNSCRVNSNIVTVVSVPEAIVADTSVAICSGQTFILPSGKKLNTEGSYTDTVRYAFGCDSLITNLQLSIQSPLFSSSEATICQGESFVLPTGNSVSLPGIYRDTIRYEKSGCDSLIRTTTLNVRALTVKDSVVVICEGSSITLPWGQTVSNGGTYSDTIRYIAGCDSLIKHVRVHVTVPVSQIVEKFICPFAIYTMLSGKTATMPGFYMDTLRTAMGCDSIITFLTLNAAPPPSIQLSKSNDVNCTLGIAKLSASGGVKYTWSPSETLNNAFVSNPVASPPVNTTYKVTVTTELGCVGQDSIVVNVLTTPENIVQLPNAFTPNGDGLNDCFGVKFLGQISHLKLSIYDRWGNRVFYTNNPAQCWDGTAKAKKLAPGVFVYYVTATTMCGDVERKGTVTLIR